MVINITCKTLIKRRSISQDRIQNLSSRLIEVRENDGYVKLGKPLIKNLRMVVFILRQSDFHAIKLLNPSGFPFPNVKEMTPPHAEKRRVQDNRIKIQVPEPAGRAINRVMIENVVPGCRVI